MDVEFTAQMEEQLDEAESGEIQWKEIIENFYPISKTLQIAEEEIGNIDLDEVTDLFMKTVEETWL